MRSSMSAASARMFTPKGFDVLALMDAMLSRVCAKSIVALARMPSPPAFDVALVRRGPATQPMPVWMMG